MLTIDAALIGTSSSPSSTKKIICFGDSLTAGTSPPLNEDFPYGPHLEAALQTNYEAYGRSLVRWRGLPGWTASALLQEGGFSGILDNIEKATSGPADLAIILAGTNDLAYESDSKSIFQSITQLHEVAHSKGVQTMAIGIPPSAWQTQSASARLVANQVNHMLENWAKDTGSSNKCMASYFPFPITLYDKESGLWSPDGLHFSPTGYKLIGESLAPAVTMALDSS